MSATGQGRLWPAGGWHSRSTPSFGIPLAFPHLRFGPIPLIATTLPLEVFTDSHERSQLRCVTSGLAETVGLEERVEDVVALAMGAKLAKPDMLCINVWSDAAIGFTGMDFETAVRGARSASGQSRRFRHRQSLPTYPEQQTFSAFVGMFQRLPNWE